MENNSGDQLTLFAEGSHARTYLELDIKKELKQVVRVYIPKCCGLLASVDQDTQFLKMSQSLLGGGDGKWFAQFLYDLAEIGQDAEWHCISASELGAAHHRDRVWIIAYPNGTNRKGLHFQKPLCAHSEKSRMRQHTRAIDACIQADDYARLRPNLNDVPEQMGELKGYGNAVVPQIPELIGRAIMEVEKNNEHVA